MAALDAERALEVLLELQDLFRKSDLELWLHYGTLLGAVRAGDFIGHDKDIDVGLTQPDPQRWGRAVDEVEAAGFELVHWTNRRDLVRIRKHDVLIDVCLFVRRRGILRGYFTCSTHVVRAKYLGSLETLEIRGHVFSVPKNAASLLEDLYGPEWLIPKVGVPGVSRAWFRETILIRPDWFERIVSKLVSKLYKASLPRINRPKPSRMWFRSG